MADDFIKQMAAERVFQEVADCCLDVAKRLLWLEGGSPGPSARETFLRLIGPEVVTRQMAEALARLHEMRNRVVHAYEAMDNRRMVARLRRLRSLVDEFVAAIALQRERQRALGAAESLESPDPEVG